VIFETVEQAYDA